MPEQSEHHQQRYSASGRCKKLQVSTLGKVNRKVAKMQINKKGKGCFDKKGVLQVKTCIIKN